MALLARPFSLLLLLVSLVRAAPPAAAAAAAAAAADLERRQQSIYGQCGGIGWTGSTTCQAGLVCTYMNDYYSQCLQGGGVPAPAPTTTSRASSTTAAGAATRVPTVYLCGDSTMAENGGGSGTQGWGHYLQYSLASTAAVVSNQAIAGRSARSFSREGRFDAVVALVQPGDWVVVEFGHNDGGSLTPTDNGRTDCFGDGAQTCATTYGGVPETVLTFPAYIKKAASQMLAKGAKVVVSAATPNNVWETGTYSWGPDRFFYYDWLAVSQLGGPAAGAYFVPHGEYAAQAMRNLGAATVDANYPLDHTHTAPYLADVMHKAFVLGLRCGTSGLGQLVRNSTASLTSTFLGPCVADFNATVNGVLR